MNALAGRLALALVASALLAAPGLAHEGHGHDEAMSGATAPPRDAFARLAALAGDWVAAEDGPEVAKGELVSRYDLTGGGSALIERMFLGTAREMATVYHRDGADLVLTHYCASGNQPRMRMAAPAADATLLELSFDGGTGLDPARDPHMRSVRLQLVGPDELIAEWEVWRAGKPDGAPLRLHLVRKR